MSLQYIIDGYNIIKQRAFARNVKTSLDLRNALLPFIKNNHLTGSQKNSIKIVFDGYSDASLRGNIAGDEVIFSGDISADEKIIKLLEKSSRRKDTIVVSDDRELRFLARSLGAKVMGVEDFILPKEKAPKRKREEAEPELTFTQKHAIDQELKRIWLKE
jgi:predicted RNA-binding protein with PIN domain